MRSNVNEENFNESMNTIFVEYGVNRFYFEHYNENLFSPPIPKGNVYILYIILYISCGKNAFFVSKSCGKNAFLKLEFEKSCGKNEFYI